MKLDLAALEQYVITLPNGGRDTSAWSKATAWPGVQAEPPKGWRRPVGAWGCLQAHVGLWRHLAEHDQPVLVLEDDAVQVAPFGSVDMPSDWDLLMLGGQHMVPPRATGHLGVVRCRETMRTHAYVLAPRAGARLEAILTDDLHSLDRQLAVATRTGSILTYAVKPWRVGQAAGRSLIDGRVSPQNTWERP